jgi:translation initiation factor IF-1
MSEKLVIVPQRKTSGQKIMYLAFFVLACLCFALSIMVPWVFVIPAILFAVLWYFMGFRSETEFEYTYYDGDLRMAKIRNKSRRKNLLNVSMEDVIAIAPRGDRSVYRYENDKTLPYKNFGSREPDARVYELICKGEKGFRRYEFEPDEEMLDEIRIKYARLVTK